MSETIVIAIITFLGGGIAEFIRSGFNYRNKKHDDLIGQITTLQRKVDELIDDVDEWKQKYYQLLIDLTDRDKQIIRNEEVLIDKVISIEENTCPDD